MRKKNLTRRLSRLRTQLRRKKLDAMLVISQANVRYLSGFTGDGSRLLITQTDALFLTDFRYVEQAEAECPGCKVVDTRREMNKTTGREAWKLGVRRLGFSPEAVSLAGADALLETLRERRVEPVRAPGLATGLRAVKEPGEVAAIRACVEAAEECLEHVRPYLEPRVRELDVVAEMEYFVRCLGFDGMSFRPIVAFGPNSSRCHHAPGRQRLKAGDPVLIDWGVRGDGYVSDLTRTFFHTTIPPRFERIYRVVLEAQRRGIQRIRPGATAAEVDGAARRCIERAGFGRRFGHGLGHGIGLQVHEGPSLAANSNAVLKRGMVLTVEPGIYIPGFGGVRIEDDVLVASRGARVLSSVPKRLSEVVIGG